MNSGSISGRLPRGSRGEVDIGGLGRDLGGRRWARAIGIGARGPALIDAGIAHVADDLTRLGHVVVDRAVGAVRAVLEHRHGSICRHPIPNFLLRLTPSATASAQLTNEMTVTERLVAESGCADFRVFGEKRLDVFKDRHGAATYV